MRRADRLFDIIQILRTASHPVTAAALAEKLEVTVRTIYRDIASLQGSRVPIEGAPGLGYVLGKLSAVVPEPLQSQLVAAPLYVSEGSAPAVTGVDLSQLRSAIRETRKLAITYIDEEGRHTQRRIWPIAMAYYVDVTLVGAWCELRNDFRHFRVDRILTSQLLDERFSSDSGRLTAEWLA